MSKAPPLSHLSLSVRSLRCVVCQFILLGTARMMRGWIHGTYTLASESLVRLLNIPVTLTAAGRLRSLSGGRGLVHATNILKWRADGCSMLVQLSFFLTARSRCARVRRESGIAAAEPSRGSRLGIHVADMFCRNSLCDEREGRRRARTVACASDMPRVVVTFCSRNLKASSVSSTSLCLASRSGNHEWSSESATADSRFARYKEASEPC